MSINFWPITLVVKEDLSRANSPTSAKHGDGVGYIKIWALYLES